MYDRSETATPPFSQSTLRLSNVWRSSHENSAISGQTPSREERQRGRERFMVSIVRSSSTYTFREPVLKTRSSNLLIEYTLPWALPLESLFRPRLVHLLFSNQRSTSIFSTTTKESESEPLPSSCTVTYLVTSSFVIIFSFNHAVVPLWNR